MADAVVIREFLATLGYRVDESAQRKFMDSITSMSNAVIGLGAGITGAAAAVTAAVANMASSASQMQYLSLTIGDTVNNIDAITFAWQKLGMAPQQTMAALQNLANMMRTQPGLAGLWEKYAGPGSLTQQLQHFGENFARMPQGEQFAVRQQFEKILGPDFFNAFLTRGTQVGGGVQEFNFARRLFHFDPDEFAKQSVAFERAWQSFQLRLNDIFGHSASPILTAMTDGLKELTIWLDAHSEEITQKLDEIGKSIREAFLGGVDLVRDITGWFQKLSPAGKEAAEALGLISLAFLKPGWLKIAGIAYVLETLLRDYEQFKKTGHSDLGIPWDHIGQKIDELGKATDGWLTPLTAIEAFFGVRLLLAAGRFFTAVTAGSATAATALTTGLGGALTRLLALIPKVGPLAFLLGTGAAGGEDQEFSKRKNEEFLRNQQTGEQGGLSDWIRHQLGYDTDPRYGGTPAAAPQQQGSGGSILERLGHVLSYLNPISVAEGAELPANVKNLSQQMATLNDTLSAMNDNSPGGGFGSWATGLGSGIVGRLFGGGASGGEDAVKSITDPKAIEAVKYLMSKGMPMHQAIGMVSNMMAESGLSTTVVNASGHAGLRQWDRQRQATFQALYGKPLTSASMHEQLDFAQWEQEHSEAKAGFMLRQAGDAISATVADYQFNERPGADDRSLGRRIGYARALGSDPRLAGSTFNGGDTISQTNNVTINTSADPNAVGRAWDEYNRRHWADLQRNQQGAVQ